MVYSTVDKQHEGQRADTERERKLIHVMNERIGIMDIPGYVLHPRGSRGADDPHRRRRSYCTATLWLFYHGTTTDRPFDIR